MSIIIPLENGNIEIQLPTPSIYIYRFLSPSGKAYIGKTADIPRRIQEHLSGKGSKLMIPELIEYGRKEFKIDILEILYDSSKSLANEREDYYIETLDTLSPKGFNQRLNREIVPEHKVLCSGNVLHSENTQDLNKIKITAKYTFTGKDGFIYFSVPEFTQLRSYQILMNLGQKKGLAKKQLGNFNYFELKISRTADLVPDCDLSQSQIYDLTLRYRKGFHIVDCQ
jgi:predicted GIY-YIG superfamily endonuclease